MELNDIPFVLFLNELSDINEPVLVNLGYSTSDDVVYKDNLLKFDRDISTSLLQINIVVPSNVKKDDIISTINKELKSSSVIHELMHLYKFYKYMDGSISKCAVYQSYQRVRLGKDIAEFMYLLYYMFDFENEVRPSELYKNLLDDNVTKDNFLKYMNSSEMMKTIEKARTFSLDKLKNNIDADEEAHEFLEHVSKQGYEKIEGSVADNILNITFINMANNLLDFTRSTLNNYLSKDYGILDFLIDSISGETSKEQKEKEERANNFYHKIANSYKNYEKNPQKYFEKLEKSLNLAGEKMKRKLFKLYDMLKDSEKTKSDSVLNWDLHTRISSKNETIKYVLNFEDFKFKKSSKKPNKRNFKK
jgi:hypothetical protein